MDPFLNGTPHHILAINNDAAVLAVFRDLLEGEGYRVSTQRYADKALAEIVTITPDLIILDYMWAYDDGGWSLLQILRMDPRTSAIPIILCTAAVREVTEIHERLTQMKVRVILKPFNIDELIATIVDMLAAGSVVE